MTPSPEIDLHDRGTAYSVWRLDVRPAHVSLVALRVTKFGVRLEYWLTARAIDDPLNGLTQFGYDPDGNLLSVTDTWASATTWRSADGTVQRDGSRWDDGQGAVESHLNWEREPIRAFVHVRDFNC